jgi:antitoxin VapB
MSADDRVRSARLFRNGRSQAVRIPKEFEFAGDEVIITLDEGRRLIIEAKTANQIRTFGDLLEWVREHGPIEDFPQDPQESDLLPLDEPRF